MTAFRRRDEAAQSSTEQHRDTVLAVERVLAKVLSLQGEKNSERTVQYRAPESQSRVKVALTHSHSSGNSHLFLVTALVAISLVVILVAKALVLLVLLI